MPADPASRHHAPSRQRAAICQGRRTATRAPFGSLVALEDDAQAVEGQELVDGLDGGRLGRDEAREPARREDARRAIVLLADALEVALGLGPRDLDGKTYGVPWYVETRLLYYRTDKVPEDPATWQETYSKAKETGAELVLTSSALCQRSFKALEQPALPTQDLIEFVGQAV